MSAPLPAEAPSPNVPLGYELGDEALSAAPVAVGDVLGDPGGIVENADLRTPPYNTVPYKSHADYVAIADEAYERAHKHEMTHGRTKETGVMYWEAAQRRIDATWMAGADQLNNLNPIDALRVAGSLAIAVETDAVPDYREPQYDEAGRLIDRRQNVQRIYSEMMVEAARQIGSEDGHVELVLDGEVEPVKPSAVMSGAIHEGGIATGDEEAAAELEEQITQEHVTPEEAETMEIPVIDPAVAAVVTRIAVKELSGAHRVPIAA